MNNLKKFKKFLEERPNLTMFELAWACWWRVFVVSFIIGFIVALFS